MNAEKSRVMVGSSGGKMIENSGSCPVLQQLAPEVTG